MATNQGDLQGWSLPEFTELCELGTGGQGRVTLAQRSSARAGGLAAIKYLHSSLLQNERELAVFRNEARMLVQVSSPHVARLERYVETPQGAAIVMEAVNGRSLRAVLDERDEPLAPEGALTLLKGSLLGLAAAHAVGVIHRDYKPANVIVEDNGGSKLVDFGIAVLTGGGGRSGTPTYMAPEQWEGESATPATDIYAATCVFYECVTGRTPYKATTIPALMYQHVTAPIPSDLAPEALRPLIERGMAKDPGRRIWDATQFVRELEEIAVTEYGPDWETRGLVLLGAAAAALASALPLTVLGLMATSPGAGALGSVAGQGFSTAGSAGSAGWTGSTGSAVKGWLAKAGGSKTTIGASTVTAVAVTAWLLWPSPPTVGGTSSGALRLTVDRPSVLLAIPGLPDGELAAPRGEWAMTISPTRVKVGMKVRLTIRESDRMPWGVEYSGGRLICHKPDSETQDAYHHEYSLGIGRHRSDPPKGSAALWLTKISGNRAAELPKESGYIIMGKADTKQTSSKYDNGDCSWHLDTTRVIEVSIPESLKHRTGNYRISTVESPTIIRARATVAGKVGDISPSAIGATVSGHLPVITILSD